MSAAKIIPIHTYDSLKRNVDKTYDNFKQAWISHIEAVQALQDSNLWQAYAPTWKAFCSKELGIMEHRASTYRAYVLDVPFALLAEDLGHHLSQHHSRRLRQNLEKVCKDAPLEQRIETYAQAAQITKQAIPTIGELSEAYGAVKDWYQNNVVEVAGESVSTKDALALNVAERIYELRKRQEIHIEQSTGKERKSLKIRVNRHILALLHEQAPNTALPPMGDEISISWYEEKKAEG